MEYDLLVYTSLVGNMDHESILKSQKMLFF